MTGTDLRRRREDLGLSRLALAIILGVDPTTVYRWETDRRQIDRVTARAIEHALDEAEQGS